MPKGRFENRESRFSSRTLLSLAATSLPETLALRAATADAPAEILLYDEIGYFGISATDFLSALAQAGDGPLNLRINSIGGDVFDGYAIYNALRARTAPVNVFVDGLAASIASVIAMAGATLTMAEPSMLMIHNAWGMCVGDRNEMLEMAAVMEKVDGQIAAVYAGKCGKPVKDLSAMMDAETWLTSTEARAQNFCDAVVAADKPDAKSNRVAPGFKALAHVGARIRAAAAPSDPDEDGDSGNEAEEAIRHINDALALHGAAAGKLASALSCLNGGGVNENDPSNRARHAPKASATTPEWVCSAATDLPIDEKSPWDGPAAQERLLDAAGFNGESPDPAKAKPYFLAWDHHNPKLKGSYKLPFADIVGGKATAFKSGLDAAASRLPDADIPDGVKKSAQAVLDAYKKRDSAENSAETALRARERRLRLAAAE
jgi:ATP-dependent protease ClpP protease subunit